MPTEAEFVAAVRAIEATEAFSDAQMIQGEAEEIARAVLDAAEKARGGTMTAQEPAKDAPLS